MSRESGEDQYCLGLYLAQHREHLKASNQTGPDCAALMRLLAAFDRVSGDHRRQLNRLRSILSLYFPAFSNFFRDLSLSALELLRTTGKPTDMLTWNLSEFMNRTTHIKHLSRKRKQDFFEKMQMEISDDEDPAVEVYLFEVELLIEQLTQTHEMKKKIEAKIKRIFDAHPLSEALASIPGCGPKVGAVLLAEMGDNPEKFKSYRAFQSFAGSSPVTKQSGKRYHNVSMRRGCRKQLRQALFCLSFSSLSYEPWAREYYDDARARGMVHSAAIRALSNKWAKIIYSIWSSGQPYNREIFLSRKAA